MVPQSPIRSSTSPAAGRLRARGPGRRAAEDEIAGDYAGAMDVVLIRHGETEWSRTGRHTGRTDVPLSDRGRDEARDAACTLDGWNITRAYTSPLGRARETAELVSPACGVEIDSQLVEWDYGMYEGRSTPEIRQELPAWSVWTHPMKGGETIE